MTVLTSTSRETKAGNGVTTSFPTTVVFANTSEIVVVHVASTGTQTLWSLGTQYSLTGAGSGSGGTLTTNSGYTVASGDSLIIRRVLAITQESDFVPNSALPAETLEGALDKLTRLLQDRELIDERSLRMDDNDPAATMAVLPYKATLANKYLAFDGVGNPMAVSTLSGPTDIFTQSGAGAINRTYLDKSRDVVSVRDFGADPSNTGAANRVAFQAAIDTGRWVFIPAGTYLLSGTLTVLGGQGLVGCLSQTLLMHEDATGNMFHVGDNALGAERAFFMNFDVWATGSKSSGAIFRCRRVDGCIWSNVRLGTLNRLAADGNRLYNGWDIQGCYRCEIDVGCVVVAQNIGIQVAGQYIAATQVWGAELNILGRVLACAIGVRCGGAFGGLYLRGEISICGVGVKITDQNAFDASYATVTGQANREIFIFDTAIIDSCDDYNVWVVANGVGIMEIQGAWMASAGQLNHAAAGVGLYVEPAANVSLRIRNALFYNNYFTGANLAGGFCDLVGVSFSGNTAAGLVTTAGASLLVRSCTFINNGGNALDIGGSVTAIRVHDNFFSGNGADVVNASGWSGAMSFFNNNFTPGHTNAGVATGTTDGSGDLTVTHGLVVTPTFIAATNQTTAAPYGFFVHTIGATTFKIRTFTVGATPAAATGITATYYWKAEVK